MIENKTIQRELKALQLIYKFEDYLFTEMAGKLQFDASYSKEDAEKLALQRIRMIYRK